MAVAVHCLDVSNAVAAAKSTPQKNISHANFLISISLIAADFDLIHLHSMFNINGTFQFRVCVRYESENKARFKFDCSRFVCASSMIPTHTDSNCVVYISQWLEPS